MIHWTLKLIRRSSSALFSLLLDFELHFPKIQCGEKNFNNSEEKEKKRFLPCSYTGIWLSIQCALQMFNSTHTFFTLHQFQKPGFLEATAYAICKGSGPCTSLSNHSSPSSNWWIFISFKLDLRLLFWCHFVKWWFHKRIFNESRLAWLTKSQFRVFKIIDLTLQTIQKQTVFCLKIFSFCHDSINRKLRWLWSCMNFT